MMNRERSTPRRVIPAAACLAVPAAVLLAVGFLRSQGSEGTVTADDAAAVKPYELVAPLIVIMERVDAVFYEMPDSLEGKKFKSLTKDAQFLAEMANVFAQVKEQRANKEWQAYAAKMKTDMLKLAEAAGKEDLATSTSLHEVVEKTCDGCHEDFRD